MRLGFLFILSAMLFVSQVNAENQYGLFMVVKGDVKVISGAKPPFPVKVGSKVFVGDVVTTGADSRAKIVMADRNVMNISPDTRMQITKYSNDAASGAKNVEIKLDEGKVRNNVEQSYDGEKSKFILKTPTAVAGVRGTQFVTSFNSKIQKTDIVTMKGQVTFASVLNGKIIGKPVIVNKGETTTSNAGAAPEVPKTVPKNELKEIDKDSMAANNQKKGDGLAGPKEGGPAGDGKGREPASEKGPNVAGPDMPDVPKPLVDLPSRPPGPPQLPKTGGCPPMCAPNQFIQPPKTKLIILPK